jgi:hypothetical protein
MWCLLHPPLGVGASRTARIGPPGGDASSSSVALPRVDGGLDTSATYPTRAVSPERGVGDRGGDSALLVLPARSLKFAEEAASTARSALLRAIQVSRSILALIP